MFTVYPPAQGAATPRAQAAASEALPDFAKLAGAAAPRARQQRRTARRAMAANRLSPARARL